MMDNAIVQMEIISTTKRNVQNVQTTVIYVFMYKKM